MMNLLFENLTFSDGIVHVCTLNDLPSTECSDLSLTEKFFWLPVMVVISSKGHGGIRDEQQR
jgi:hypothetical protein